MLIHLLPENILWLISNNNKLNKLSIAHIYMNDPKSENHLSYFFSFALERW